MRKSSWGILLGLGAAGVGGAMSAGPTSNEGRFLTGVGLLALGTVVAGTGLLARSKGQ